MNDMPIMRMTSCAQHLLLGLPVVPCCMVMLVVALRTHTLNGSLGSDVSVTLKVTFDLRVESHCLRCADKQVAKLA